MIVRVLFTKLAFFRRFEEAFSEFRQRQRFAVKCTKSRLLRRHTAVSRKKYTPKTTSVFSPFLLAGGKKWQSGICTQKKIILSTKGRKKILRIWPILPFFAGEKKGGSQNNTSLPSLFPTLVNQWSIQEATPDDAFVFFPSRKNRVKKERREKEMTKGVEGDAHCCV